VVDDLVLHGIVGEEGDDAHLASALRTDHGVNFIHFTDHLSPALGGDGLVLDNPERKSRKVCLPDLAPMGVDVEAKISHHDLAFVRDGGARPGKERFYKSRAK